ncbi:hypothetical protein AT15_07490 [Kosmotoga arenicorallina S304]|uniref:DNA-binding protein n=1 Tax=Kosmotoga arenicorallina S304 TaxID=1453497 RepID=A0A182C759_9BACT|nr:DUF177 domain-containing protein [Kosmotoga arenicorallina]OAA31331.1 hypothetical protein AT15_07490 [Kosmotoga arenicorallina S304]
MSDRIVRELLVDINSFEDTKKIVLSIDNPFEEIECYSPITIELVLYKEKDSIIVSGNVNTTVVEKCSRCLKSVRLPVDGIIEALYVSQGKFLDRNKSGPAGELDNMFLLSGDILDLSERVIEAIIVEIPQKILCSNDCKGLCPVCGMDLNENPQHHCETPKEPQDKWHSLLYNLKENISKDQ